MSKSTLGSTRSLNTAGLHAAGLNAAGGGALGGGGGGGGDALGETANGFMTVGPPSTLAAGSSFLLEWALTSQPEIETALRALTAEVRHLELELTRRLEHEQQRAAEAAAAARSEHEGAYEGAQSAARQRLRAALERLVRMLPSAACASTSSPNGNAAAEAAPAPAAASAQYSASRERREEVLVAEALEGALRAQKFHREKVDECRRLRASVRRQSDRSGFVTSFVTHGFRFDDRVAFVRRASVPGGVWPPGWGERGAGPPRGVWPPGGERPGGGWPPWTLGWALPGNMHWRRAARQRRSIRPPQRSIHCQCMLHCAKVPQDLPTSSRGRLRRACAARCTARKPACRPSPSERWCTSRSCTQPPRMRRLSACALARPSTSSRLRCSPTSRPK